MGNQTVSNNVSRFSIKGQIDWNGSIVKPLQKDSKFTALKNLKLVDNQISAILVYKDQSYFLQAKLYNDKPDYDINVRALEGQGFVKAFANTTN